MFIRTAQGVTSSSKQGRLSTAHGDFVGYIVPESEYSLCSLETEMQRDGGYTQPKHTAEVGYSDGTVRQYYKKNRMWVVDVCGSDCEVACAACEKKLEHAAKGTHTIHSVVADPIYFSLSLLTIVHPYCSGQNLRTRHSGSVSSFSRYEWL